MDLLSSLNPAQQEAVRQTEGPLLILAGAGSGKTRVIAHRIAYLVSEKIAYPDQIMAVTFTNKAAQEMRERVEQLLDTDCRAMWVSTFHALCARLLRREAHNIGLSRDFTIYDSADQQAVIKQLLKEYHLADETYQPRMVLGRISAAKNRMEGPESFANTWNAQGQGDRQALRGLHQGAEGRERARLRRPAAGHGRVVRARIPAVRERYAHRFRYVMVDEYQDTNRPQYLLIKQIAGKHRNLAVVGDPDQSIYKWRGADLRNIMDFETDFCGCADRPPRAELPLDRGDPGCGVGGDRQQPQSQEEGALDRPEGRREDPVVPRRRRARRGRIHHARSRERRSRTTTRRIMAVLYRTNSQSRAVEDSLRAAGIAYVMLGGVGFYERREVKDALSYLKLILNPHDDIALRRVINVPARGIGKGVMDALEGVDVSQVDINLPPLLVGLSGDGRAELAVDEACHRG